MKLIWCNVNQILHIKMKKAMNSILCNRWRYCFLGTEYESYIILYSRGSGLVFFQQRGCSSQAKPLIGFCVTDPGLHRQTGWEGKAGPPYGLVDVLPLSGPHMLVT